MAAPNVFAYTNYREYLRDYLAQALGDESIRGFCRRCGIASPNYLQQVIAGRRNLTRTFVLRFAKGARLDAIQAAYLGATVDLGAARTAERRQKVLDEMRKLVQRAERRTITDEGIHASWTHPVVWELAKTRLFRPEPRAIRALFGNAASEEDLARSLAYLSERGYIQGGEAGHPPTPANVDFAPTNDVRRIDLQRSHLRFLQLAQHRLNDPLQEREFQGLTMAIRQSDFAKLRQRCRDFVAELNDAFSVDAEGDEVVRVQLCAFKVTRTYK